jgi:hypothetical protein
MSAEIPILRNPSHDLLEIALQLAGHQDEVGILNLLSDSRERVCAGVGATEQGVVLVQHRSARTMRLGELESTKGGIYSKLTGLTFP